MSEHDQDQQHKGEQDAGQTRQTPVPDSREELVYRARIGPDVELRLYRDGPGYGRAQWASVEHGTVLVEEQVRLRLGWEEGRAETDPYHWMIGFVDASTPDAPMSWVSRPIPAEVTQRMVEVEPSIPGAGNARP